MLIRLDDNTFVQENAVKYIQNNICQLDNGQVLTFKENEILKKLLIENSYRSSEDFEA